MPTQKNDWVDVTDLKQSDIFWSLFHNYESPSYMFAEKYDRNLVKKKILATHRIQDVIEKHKEETGVDNNTAYKNAASIIDEISHAFSLRTIRFMAYMIMKTVRRLFKEVLVNKEGIDAFQECSILAPVILAPTHNSYFDFILISYVCFALNLPIPAIAAGQDFLNMAVVNRLLRGSGAFYMRRSFATDFFYKSIFTEYVQLVLSIAERPIEFFPEGTRSRCGKALQPKVGLLSMVLESFVHGFVPDVSFIPISMSFEKITEESLYMFELLGIPKPKESLMGMLRARSVLYSDYGSVCIHFGRVLSLREYCIGKIDNIDYVKIPRCERHLKFFGREESEMKTAKSFAIKIVLAQQKNMVIYPRAVVAAYLLQHRKCDIESLAHITSRLGLLLSQLGCQLHNFEGLLSDKTLIVKALEYSNMVLNVGLNTVVYDCFQLSSVTSMQNDLSRVLKDLECHALGYVYLSSQRNRLIYSCFFSSVLLASVSRSPHIVICKEVFSFLCDLLQFEVIIDANHSNEKAFLSTVSLLQKSNLVLVANDQILFAKDKVTEIEFLQYLLQPFYDAYLIAMETLLVQKVNFPISFKLLAVSLQLHSIDIIKRCGLATFESLSLHTLSNVIIYLSKSGHLSTVKNAKFEILVSGVNKSCMMETSRKLANYVSPCLKKSLQGAKL